MNRKLFVVMQVVLLALVGSAVGTANGRPIKSSNSIHNSIAGDGRMAAPRQPLTISLFGDGRDEDLVLSPGQNMVINTVKVSVTASWNSAAPANSNGFNDGDVVLFHQSQGVFGVGNYEFNQIAHINSQTSWALVNTLANVYDSTSERAQVIKVPQYRSVNVQAGSTLTALDWHYPGTGDTGGILVFLCNGTTTIAGSVQVKGQNGGVITSNGGDQDGSITIGGGFRGGYGATHSSSTFTTSRGEGYASIGWASHDYSTSSLANAGGGAFVIGGGSNGDGGGAGSNGTAGGNGSTGGNGTGGSGATDTSSPADLSRMWFGGGSAGGGNDNFSGETTGSGGSGGGIVYISSRVLTVTGSITTNGGNGGGSNQQSGGGGGAGGSILLKSQVVGLGSSLVTALGGSGGANGGGNGGAGRIHMEYCDSFSGSTNPSASTQQITCPPVLIMGHVNWQGRPAQPSALQQLPITLTLKSAATELNYPSQATDATGYFTNSLAGVTSGLYLYRAKGPKYLANSGTVDLTGGAVTNLEIGPMIVGDANDDNRINSLDFTILRNTFGKASGDPGYDGRAEFNGDNVVSTLDFNLLRGNFGLAGAPPIRPMP